MGDPRTDKRGSGEEPYGQRSGDDQIDARGDGTLALRELQLSSETGAAVRRQHAEHMRPVHRPSGLHADDRIDEADHLAAFVERADEDAAQRVAVRLADGRIAPTPPP